MKRVLCLFLFLLLTLTGCTMSMDRWKEPVTFYYLRDHATADNHGAFFMDGAIGSEIREGAGHRNDLNYLLSMYLQGPMDPQLRSLFPADCRIMDIGAVNRDLTVNFNAALTQLNDMELTIASACLAQTCMELTDIDCVHIQSYAADGKLLFSRSFTADSLLLKDTNPNPTESTQ